jgi:hypothetical protein
MRTSMMTALLGGALWAGLASFPLLAADLASAQPDSSAGGFYALVLGLYAVMVGGMAVCYGFVKLAERVVHNFQARHSVPIPMTHIRHAA